MTNATNEVTAITGTNAIEMYRMLTLRSALKLEMAGMKRRGRSAFSIIKDELKAGGTRVQILADWDAKIRAFARDNDLTQPMLR